MKSIENGILDTKCLETVIQTMAEGLMIIDTGNTIVFCNKAFPDLVGFGSDQLIGKQCRDIMECGPKGKGMCSLFAQGEVNGLECTVRHRSGRLVPVKKNSRLLHDAQGNLIGAVETLSDISKLKVM